MSFKYDQRLSRNFLVKEFFTTSHNPLLNFHEFLDQPNTKELEQNLRCMAGWLQMIRDYYGKPIKIASGYRSPRVNKAVGGATASQHLAANAVDITVEGVSTTQVYRDWQTIWPGGLAINPGAFVHFDLRGHRSRWTY